MKIQLLGAHNCEAENIRLVSLLIDDIMAIDAGGLTSGLSIQSQLALKAILLTHQHYDHIRDIPAIAMNLFLNNSTAINVYSIPSVYDTLVTSLLNDKLYPNFLERPQADPAIKFTKIEPYQTRQIEGYNILAVPVNHSVPAVGFQITSPDGKTIFFTGDTGPSLAACWGYVSPQLIITEVTAPNRYEEFGKISGHLTPALLKQELVSFREVKGYLPDVVTVHMNPYQEKEIEAEIATVAKALGNTINVGYEGMRVHL